MSLYSHVSGSTTQSAVEAESNRSLTTSKSLPSHSGTSGIHETDTPDIHSIFSDDLELSQCKSPAVSSAKTRSHKGTLSADVQSDVRSQASAGFFGSPLSRCQSRSIPPSRQSLRKNPDKMTDFEREFFSEDYMSGDEGDEENVMNNSLTPSGPENEPECSFGSEKYKDFLRCLPVHLSKRILGMLDKNSLTNCLCLSKHWRVLAEEVKQDYMVHQIMTEEIMLMQVSFRIKRMCFSIKCTPIFMDSLQGAKKIIFTACYSGKLKLAFTSPDVISTSLKSFLSSRIDFTLLLLLEFLKEHHLPIGQVKNRFH